MLKMRWKPENSVRYVSKFPLQRSDHGVIPFFFFNIDGIIASAYQRKLTHHCYLEERDSSSQKG